MNRVSSMYKHLLYQNQEFGSKILFESAYEKTKSWCNSKTKQSFVLCSSEKHSAVLIMKRLNLRV